MDTITYCAKKDNFIVPSVGLWARIYIECLKNPNNPNTKKIITHLSNYWLRTMTLISFPAKDRKGYIVHYPSLNNNDLARKIGVSNELSEIVKEQLDYYPSLWLAPEVCMETSPERMFVFGGFKQYGQGLWLTVNSSDKAIVGTRPFIGIYKK